MKDTALELFHLAIVQCAFAIWIVLILPMDVLVLLFVGCALWIYFYSLHESVEERKRHLEEDNEKYTV